MDPSPEQLAPIEAQFNSHPAIQAFLASGNFNVMGWMRAVGQAARDLNIQMPHDYQPAIRDGKVTLQKKDFIARNGWFLPAVAVGAPIAAGAALGAFGGAAAAGAAGGGGAGAGTGGAGAAGGGLGAASALEGSATTGLAGSGFGAGAATPILGGGASAATEPILSEVGTGTMNAGNFGAINAAANEAGGGGFNYGSLLNRDNILGAAGIVQGGIGAYQQAQRDRESAENERLRLQLAERTLSQNNEQFGANFGQRNEQFGVDTGFRNKELELKAPGQRLTTGVRGSMVANQSPVTAHWGGPGSGLSGGIVKFTGGAANPNLINADARALGEDVTHQALLQQLAHDDKVPYNPTPYTPTQRDPILDMQQPSTTAEAVDAYGRRRTPTSILDPDNDRAILRTR